ncbi:MaoC/PaaZ C-terminal domain-containing protein [Paenibacillus sp. FSL K6-0108]|uniref:MaoC family dehydratase n=1 Tax=Paenibacillus sp. FSL K6-0108 TaxID=2921417 RepID=UPI003249AE50
MDYSAWIGVSTARQRVVITKEQIGLFSLGFPELFRPATRNIPLTYPIVWWQQEQVPWMDIPDKIMIHGQQAFAYERELQYDEELFYQIRLANARQTKGSQGSIHLLGGVLEVTDISRRPVLSAETTLVLMNPPAIQTSFSNAEQEYPRLFSKIHYMWDGKQPPLIGAALLDVCLGTITSDMLVDYANASNDTNPIHLDIIKARVAGAPLRIVQGMLIGGMIGNRLQSLEFDNWAVKNLKYRFRTPVLEGDVVRVIVRVVAVSKTLPKLECTIEVYVEHPTGANASVLAYEGSVCYEAR